VWLRQIGRRQRDGNHSGIQTAEKRRDELETRRIKQQRTLPDRAVTLQQRPNTPGLTIQRRMGQMIPFRLSID
jgi:hypothetical protein